MLLVSHLYLKIDTELRGPIICIPEWYGALIWTPWLLVLRNTAPPEQLQTVLTMCAQRAQYSPSHTSAPYLKILIMQDLSWTDTVWFCSTIWLIAYDSLWVQFFLCATVYLYPLCTCHTSARNPLVVYSGKCTSSKNWAVSWRLFCTHRDVVFVGVKTVDYYYFQATINNLQLCRNSHMGRPT